MKTLSLFILEATEKDLKAMGASSAQVAELKRRERERAKRGIDKGFGTGDDRNKDKKKVSGQKPVGALPPAKASTPAPPTATPQQRAADKGGEIVKAKREGEIVRTKRGGTDKEAVGVPKKTGPGVRKPEPKRGPGTKTYDRVRPAEKDKKRTGVPYGSELMSPDERQKKELERKRRRAAKTDGTIRRGAKRAAGAAAGTTMSALRKAGSLARRMGKAKLGDAGKPAADLQGLSGRDKGLID